MKKYGVSKTRRARQKDCPDCGTRLDRVNNLSTDIEDEAECRQPKPGDFTICLECGAILVFGDDLRPRTPTPWEIEITRSRGEWDSLLVVRQNVQLQKARERNTLVVINTEDDQPPELKQLVGLRLKRAWLMPSRQSLSLAFEEFFVLINAATSDLSNEAMAVSVKVGKSIPEPAYSQLDETTPWNAHLDALGGAIFLGLKPGARLTFQRRGGELIVAGLTPRGIRWVRSE